MTIKIHTRHSTRKLMGLCIARFDDTTDIYSCAQTIRRYIDDILPKLIDDMYRMFRAIFCKKFCVDDTDQDTAL